METKTLMIKFWMIWREGSTGMSKAHYNKTDAIIEAECLARENPEKIFHLLESQGYCQATTPVVWVRVGEFNE